MMRVGLDSYTIRGLRLGALEQLEWVHARGLDGLQLGVAELSQTGDPGEIAEVASHARRLGLYLDAGISTVNPHRRVRSGNLAAIEAETARLKDEIRAARLAGTRAIRSTLGSTPDRFNPRVPWQQQLDDTARFIARLAPLLRDLDCRLAIETHGDATTWELVRLAEATDGATGILLDTSNVLVRVEEPLAAARRAAPHVIATHAKDAILFFDEPEAVLLRGEGAYRPIGQPVAPNATGWRGVVRQNRPCGQGVLPWPDVLAALARYQPDLRLSIEDHRGLYPVPVHDLVFIAAHPDLTAAELGAFVGLAWQCQRRILRGEIVPPDEAEAIPWEEEQDRRVGASAAFLKRVVKEGEPVWQRQPALV